MYVRNDMIPVITIDGPTGSGKGTVGRLLARKFGWHFLDSGILYRALAYAVSCEKVALDDLKLLQRLISLIEISFSFLNDKIFFKNREISKEIRNETYGNMASKISVKPFVRVVLLNWQREFLKEPGLVADGRDMGTVVFPDAKWKFFLTASSEERAHRRYKQLKNAKVDVTLTSVFNDLLKRDKRDIKRSIAPLKPAHNAVCIDTTKLSIETVLKIMTDHIVIN